MKYRRLFEPINLGNVRIKNRIYLPPAQLYLSEDPSGRFTHRFIAYFRERAKGGVGLIMTCHVRAERTIDPYPAIVRFPCIEDPIEKKFFAELAEAVHEYGAKIACQLSAGTGRLADTLLDGYYPAAPSEIPLFNFPDLKTRALTTQSKL